MKKNLFVLLWCLFLSVGVTVTIKAQNTFEGKRVIVDAPDAGSQFAVRYGTVQYVVVKLTNGSIPSAGDISAGNSTTCPKFVSAVSYTGTEVQVSTDSTTGLFCFRGNQAKYSITVQGTPGISAGKIVYNYWPPNSFGTTDYNVKDFGAKGDGVADDTEEIRSALAFIASRNGGTLHFPSGDYLIGNPTEAVNSGLTGLTLPSGVTVVGVTGISQQSLHGYTPGTVASASGQFSRIRLSATSVFTTIFRVGELSSNIKLKNIVLRADLSSGAVRTGTIGLEGLGKRLNSPAQVIGAEDVAFEQFDYGFRVKAIPELTGTPPTLSPVWQFDFVRVDHCFFVYNKTAGIHTDSFNTDWRVVNSVFVMPAKATGVAADAIKALHIGGLLIESTFAGGSGSGSIGGNFIDVDDAAVITLIGSESEYDTNSFVFGNASGAGAYGDVITFINNVLEKVRFGGRATFVSTGNRYLASSFDDSGTSTLNIGVVIYSTGDRFCYDSYTAGCTTAGTADFKGGKVAFTTGQFADNGGTYPVAGRPTLIGTDLKVTGDANDNTKAALSINATYPKPLFELGDRNGGTYVYTITRASSAYLDFQGTQALPDRGYQFDAPVRLGIFTAATLPIAPNGAMVYCSNCQKTTPCSSGGTGALAVAINGQYECK